MHVVCKLVPKAERLGLLVIIKGAPREEPQLTYYILKNKKWPGECSDLIQRNSKHQSSIMQL
jgi:hypothetical protein